MNQDQFVARRSEQWQRLAQILADIQKQGTRRLALDQAQQLGQLYRRTASDLAYARTYFPGTQTADYLNGLVSQAHHLIYAEEPQRLKALWRFFAAQVPQAIRAAWRPLALSTALALLGGLVGFFAILYDPNLADALVPEQLRHFAAKPREGEIFPVEFRSLIGTVILLNNVRVALLAFGLGVTLGVGTAVLLFHNGVVVGALAAHFHTAGLSYPFWALILPHGVLELLAIFLAGAAGLIMGWSLVAVGDQTRRDSFAAGARRAVVLMMGALPLLVVAAAIEGFVTPMTSLPDGGKYLVAAGTGVLALLWLLWPGKKVSATAAPAP